MNDKDYNKYVNEAVESIRSDRSYTLMLLQKTTDCILGATDDKLKFVTNRDLGLVASKYLETLQRSNEQLVKILSIVRKDKEGSETVSEEEKDSIYNDIKETNSKKKKAD